MQLRVQQKNLFSLTIILFVENLCFYLTYPMLYYLLSSRGHLLPLDYSDNLRMIIFSLLVAITPLSNLTVGTFLSILSDRFGRKPILLVNFILGVFGFLAIILSVYTYSIALLFIGRILVGCANGSRMVATAAIADFTRGEQRAKYYAIFLFANALALAMGPHLGFLLSNVELVNWFDITTPLWISLALMLFNLVLLLEFFRDATRQKVQQTTTQDTWSYVSNTIFTGSHRALLLAVFFLHLVWISCFFDISLYLKVMLNYSDRSIGIVYTYIAFSLAVGLVVIFPILQKKYQIQTLLKIGVVMQIIALIMLSISNDLSQWIGMTVIGVAGGILYASNQILIANSFPDHREGLAMGIYGAASKLAWVIAMLLPGVLFNVNWYLPPIIMLIIIVYVWYIYAKRIDYPQLAKNAVE